MTDLRDSLKITCIDAIDTLLRHGDDVSVRSATTEGYVVYLKTTAYDERDMATSASRLDEIVALRNEIAALKATLDRVKPDLDYFVEVPHRDPSLIDEVDSNPFIHDSLRARLIAALKAKT